MSRWSNLSLALSAILMTSLWSSVQSHGRLWTPPGRATMWRRGFHTPANYNDNQMFCGGLSHEQSQGYQCGLCGDPYDSDRPHEAGGLYATGTIASTYTQGQEVVLEVELTANHKGWFEFKLCPTNDKKVKATQDCLDLHPLQLSDGSGTKLDVSELGSKMISIPVKLPQELTCDLCMLQWRYHGGNNWGTDEDGKSCDGCGFSSQEEFYGCADVKIRPSNDLPTSNTTTTTTTDPAATSPSTTARVYPFIPPHPDKPTFYQHMKHHHPNNNNNNTKPASTTTSPDGLTTARVYPFIPPHPDKPTFYQHMKHHHPNNNNNTNTKPASTTTSPDIFGLTTARVYPFIPPHPDKPTFYQHMKHHHPNNNNNNNNNNNTKAASTTTSPDIFGLSTARVYPFIPPHPDKPTFYQHMKHHHPNNNNNNNNNNTKPVSTTTSPDELTTARVYPFIPPHPDKPTFNQHMKHHHPNNNNNNTKPASTTTSPDIFGLTSRLSSLPSAKTKTLDTSEKSPFHGREVEGGPTTPRANPFVPPHPDNPNTSHQNNVKPRPGAHCAGAQQIPGLNHWCEVNCKQGTCPESHCSCQ